MSKIAIFLFYNISRGVQSVLSFSKEYQHCGVITFDGSFWVYHEMDKYGIHTRVLETKDGVGLLRALRIIKPLTATVTVWVETPIAIRWKPFWIRSCNEFCRYVAGVDVGLTLNPMHLLKKLLQYREAKNYEILDAWRRKGWDSSAVVVTAETTTPTT